MHTAGYKMHWQCPEDCAQYKNQPNNEPVSQ